MKPNCIFLSSLIVQFASVSVSLGTGQKFLKWVDAGNSFNEDQKVAIFSSHIWEEPFISKIYLIRWRDSGYFTFKLLKKFYLFQVLDLSILPEFLLNFIVYYICGDNSILISVFYKPLRKISHCLLLMLHDYSSMAPQNKLGSVDADLASPRANLEGSVVRWVATSFRAAGNESHQQSAVLLLAWWLHLDFLLILEQWIYYYLMLSLLPSPPCLSPFLLQSCLPFSILNPPPSVHSQTQQLWLSSVPNIDWARHRAQGEQSMSSAFKALTVRVGGQIKS